jgi:hypothetical protein
MLFGQQERPSHQSSPIVDREHTLQGKPTPNLGQTSFCHALRGLSLLTRFLMLQQ